MQVLPPSSTGGPSRLFIMRPVATTLLMVAILLAGIIGYRALPVSALPEVDYPTIQVVTLYPGASPDVMTSAVTAPLERQFGQMSGLKQMSSQSSGGASVITLQFQLTLPLDVAEQEVQAAINAATNLLPSDLPNPPVYSKVNPADPPIMTLAVTSTAMPMTQVEDMVETRVAQKISQISGVGLVTLSGGQRPAVRVKLNAQAIAALGLTSETVRTAITGANVNSAKGSLDGPSRAVTLSANDQMQSAEEYRQLIIAYQNGAPIRLGDVATVEQGAENSWLGAWANKEQAIVMNVQRQPGANIISTADSIRQEVQATYAPATDMAAIRQQMTTLSEQTEANFTWTVSQYGTLASEVQDAKEATEEQMRLIQTYMTFGENGLVIGKSGNPFTFRVVNDRLAFYMNNTEVAYLSNNKLYVTQAEILTRLQVGKFAFEPQTNGNLSLIYTG